MIRPEIKQFFEIFKEKHLLKQERAASSNCGITVLRSLGEQYPQVSLYTIWWDHNNWIILNPDEYHLAAECFHKVNTLEIEASKAKEVKLLEKLSKYK